ncbi:MAG: nucleoside-diphosphate sugar epimerase/dehydratase [Pseudomonadota bacterium]
MSDIVILSGALWVGLALRYGTISVFALERFIWVFFALPLVGVAVFWRLGLYNTLLRSMEARAIAILSAGSFALALFLFVSGLIDNRVRYPRSLPAIYGLLVFVSIGGLRVILRTYYRHLMSTVFQKMPVLIYGAGTVGTQLASIIKTGQEFEVVGFLDDDPALKRNYIGGLRVHSPSKAMSLIERYSVKRILLASHRIGPGQKKGLIERISGADVEIQTVPKPSDIISGRLAIDQLREVRIEDLLGREPVPPIPSLFSEALKDKSILVTGAGGSIGSEICRQILTVQPKRAVFVDSSELALYQLEQWLGSKLGSDVADSCAYVLANVLDQKHLKNLFDEHSFDIVFHAAAYKHVPMLEKNECEGVRNNVFGTRNIAELAIDSGVERFVLVSSDKAVRPANVMGASKRLAEIVIQNLQRKSNATIFTMVRFGNVLGSSGSVLPLFKRQIEKGGPVTVTHQNMRRYFMTISEASQLVIQAGSMAEGGEVYVLEMGEPVNINDLARLMIRLSGRTIKDGENPAGEIEIHYSGLRPGEKMYEELLIDDTVIETNHPKIMRANERSLSDDDLTNALQQLETAIGERNDAAVRAILEETIEGYPHIEDRGEELSSAAAE